MAARTRETLSWQGGRREVTPGSCHLHCVLLHSHTHIHTHVHTHTFTHTFTRTSTHTFTHMFTHMFTHTRSHTHIHTRHLAFQEEPQNYKWLSLLQSYLCLQAPFTHSAPPENDLYGRICLFLFCLPIGFGSGGTGRELGVGEEWGTPLRTLAGLKWTQFSPRPGSTWRLLLYRSVSSSGPFRRRAVMGPAVPAMSTAPHVPDCLSVSLMNATTKSNLWRRFIHFILQLAVHHQGKSVVVLCLCSDK